MGAPACVGACTVLLSYQCTQAVRGWVYGDKRNMPIVTGDLFEISLGMGTVSTSTLNVWQYRAGTGLATASASEVGAAWWNHVKNGYRGIQTVSYGGWFRSVFVRQLNDPAGLLGEFAIPVGEASGTRADPSLADPMPFSNAVGVKLAVGTGATRPGGKRFQCLVDGDVNVNNLTAGVVTAVSTLMDTMVADMLLGAPAATLRLEPIVCRKDAAGLVVAHQPITGYVVRGQATTQVSRKPWRGM